MHPLHAGALRPHFHVILDGQVGQKIPAVNGFGRCSDHRQMNCGGAICNAQFSAANEGFKLCQLCKCGHIFLKLGTNFFLDSVADLAAKEGFTVQVARHQFQVQI